MIPGMITVTLSVTYIVLVVQVYIPVLLILAVLVILAVHLAALLTPMTCYYRCLTYVA